MATAIIKLTYRHVINRNAETALEKNIFQASYREFLFKSQAYNHDGTLRTFTQMKAKDGRANSLHYKISFAALHFLDELKNTIPGFKDVFGTNVKYETPAFELVESDIIDPNAHCVAIKFVTAPLVLHLIIGDVMVLSYQLPGGLQSDVAETFTVKMQPNLAITSFCDQTEGANTVNTFNQN